MSAIKPAAKRLSFLVIPAVMAAGAIVAGLMGPSRVSAANSEDSINQSLKSFTKIYEAVEQNYADPVKPDKAVYQGAIPGMLRTLDPHSNFFDPRAFQLLREDQRGHYYGVGMTVGARDGKTYIMEPFSGSPAFKAGLRRGDVILRVNDKSAEKLNTTEIADLLKGPRGTTVQVTVQRLGVEKPISFNIVRDEIPRSSVADGFWLRPGVGYVSIKSFNENTSKEMEEQLKKLGESNIKGLILDLRDNPGGLLNEGVEVAGHFLRRGEVVVSHRGRSTPEKPYYARRGNGGKEYPIVVLVNRYSASAAEIVAGALQDHDRGWVFGENTFGKGLVQTVYPLSENTGLALTTAHYYTPSGRLIQRDYNNISFLDYYYHRNLEQKNMQDVKMTDSGRTVYGGGGISPDEKYEFAKLNNFQTNVLRKYALFNFAAKYFGVHGSKLPKGWEPDQNLMNEFRDFLRSEKVEFTEAEFIENQQWAKDQLKREMYISAFGPEESQRVAIEIDPMVAKGIDSLPKAKNLIDTAKKMMVKRLNPDGAAAR
jgi:carboxyl-terminal processing protease